MSREKPEKKAEQPLAKLEKELVDIDFISASDKIDIVLIKLGLKPASHFEIFWHKNLSPTYTEEQFNERKNTLQRFLNTFEIINEQHESESTQETEEDDPTIYSQFIIAKDRPSLEKLKSALKKHNQLTEGCALGYPETAVLAFSNRGQSIRRAEVPKEAKTLGYELFPSFLLSKDNWQEEIIIISLWLKAVKDNTPNLYQQITNQNNEPS